MNDKAFLFRTPLASMANSRQKRAIMISRASSVSALRRSARLLKELPAFEKIPFDKIGLYKDEYRRKLPMR